MRTCRLPAMDFDPGMSLCSRLYRALRCRLRVNENLGRMHTSISGLNTFTCVTADKRPTLQPRTVDYSSMRKVRSSLPAKLWLGWHPNPAISHQLTLAHSLPGLTGQSSSEFSMMHESEFHSHQVGEKCKNPFGQKKLFQQSKTRFLYPAAVEMTM